MNTQKENRVRFGLLSGVPVDVSAVESGLACGCVCAACGHPLQAKKGKKNVHHFSHDPSGGVVVCASAFETSIHFMAKEILKEDGFLELPDLTIEDSAVDEVGTKHTLEIQVEESSDRHLQHVELEKRLGDIRPDIVAYSDGDPFIVEVAVTSFADDRKKEKIRKLGLSAVEIDLSSVDYSTTKTELRELIHSDETEKSWLSNPKAIAAKKTLKADLDAEIQRANAAYRRSARSSQAPDALPVRRASALSRTKIHSTDTKEKTRWFRCESCCCVFELPLSVALPSARSVTCPDCGQSVSTDPRQTWR